MAKGKVVIVTGAGQGIGESIAKLFASEEMNVVVADIKKESGKRTVGDIERSGGRAIFVETDVSKRSSTDRMVEATLKKFGRLDILVNNAGINYITPIYEDVDEDEWDGVLAVNVKGVYFCMRAAARPMPLVPADPVTMAVRPSSEKIEKSMRSSFCRLHCLCKTNKIYYRICLA